MKGDASMEEPPAAHPSSPPPTPASLPAPIETTIADALRPELESASLGDRLVAQLVDGLIAVGLFFFVGMLLAPRFGGATAAGFNLEGAPAVLAIAGVLFGWFFYFVLLELLFGATFGKVVAGARVRTVEGRRIGLGAAIVRNAMRVIDGIAFYLVGTIAVLVTRRNQRLGDLAAHTVVVRRDWPGILRVFALFLALGLAIAGVVGGFVLRPPTATGEPRFASTILTDDRDVAVDKTLFSPATPAFYILFTLADAPADTTVRVIWTAEQVQGEQPELRIGEGEMVAGGDRNQGSFSLPRSSFSWPIGAYRADLYIGSQLARTIHFRIEAPPSGAAASPSPAGSPPPASPTSTPPRLPTV
jgi:uncharacterized RDD family membrane protein YckC